MTSLFMLAWLSFLVALLHVFSVRSILEKASFSTVEAICLSAALMEAGYLESGSHTAGRRIVQAAALLVSLAYMVMAIWYF